MIHSTAVIYPDVEIGERVHIGAYCVIGDSPEHRDYYDKPGTGVIIKDDVRIRSHVSIDSGTKTPTTIGCGSTIFNHSHIGHDCVLGSNVLIGGGCSLAGHTKIMEGANVSGHSCTFQRVVIGAYSFIGGMSFVTRNIPPGEKWLGLPVRYVGQNGVGLDRASLTYEECLEKYEKIFEELCEEV